MQVVGGDGAREASAPETESVYGDQRDDRKGDPHHAAPLPDGEAAECSVPPLSGRPGGW